MTEELERAWNAYVQDHLRGETRALDAIKAAFAAGYRSGRADEARSQGGPPSSYP